MVIKRLLGALADSGAAVDTILDDHQCQPGAKLTGKVHIATGSKPISVESVTLILVVQRPASPADAGGDRSPFGSAATFEIARVDVARNFAVTKYDGSDLSCTVHVPWETPLNSINTPDAITVGLRTELAINRATDQTDLDPVRVSPLPAQQGVLAGLTHLGFDVTRSTLESQRLARAPQTLPFFQKISLRRPAPESLDLQVGFVAAENTLDVVLEIGNSGAIARGGPTAHHFQVTHAQAEQVDWSAELGRWLATVT